MSSNEHNVNTDSSTVASRKLAAAELRKARKAARDPRNRLFSDTSDEVPKGILKNSRPIPTKRSVSECVDDLSQIMDHLNLDINDLPKNTGKFCPHHCDRLRLNRRYGGSQECFDEEDENTSAEGGDEDDDSEDRDSEEKENNTTRTLDRKECDCNNNYGDDDNSSRPKKSVRFNDHVYETVFFASRLYDRRYFAKYHFSSRHHPPSNAAGNNNKSKKNNNKNSNASKSDNKDEQTNDSANSKSDSNKSCKLTKSQRARQSKKDKKKRLQKREEVADMGSDDQGYCSSLHSFSD